MAQAPRPGTTPSSKGEAARRQGITIQIYDRKVQLRIADLGPRDAQKVRDATGHSLQEAIGTDSPDLDTIAVLFWLARVKDGERDLTYDQVLDEFPGYADLDGNLLVEAEELVEDEAPESPEA